MLAQGLQLMALGMTTVVAFLGLLVALMEVSGRTLPRLAPDAAPATPPQADDELEIAIALAAIAAHRRGAA